MSIGKKSFFDNDISVTLFNDGKKSFIDLYPNGYLLKINPGDKSSYVELEFSDINKIIINENGPVLTIYTDQAEYKFDKTYSDIRYLTSFFKRNNIENVEKVMKETIQEKKSEQNYSVPTIASLLMPGLGQFLKKHFAKGFIILFSTIILAFTKFWVIIPLLYIISAYDAYNSTSDL